MNSLHPNLAAPRPTSSRPGPMGLASERVTHLKVISVDKGSGTTINVSSNVPRRSMKGLLLFYEPHIAGARDSEKTFNL